MLTLIPCNTLQFSTVSSFVRPSKILFFQGLYNQDVRMKVS